CCTRVWDWYWVITPIRRIPELMQHIQRGWSFFNEEMNEFVDLLPAQQRMKGENWYRGTADMVARQDHHVFRFITADNVEVLG
ncbi:hypothetical protein ACUOFC_62705, partial [Escherichia sp. TWPC-MK]